MYDVQDAMAMAYAICRAGVPATDGLHNTQVIGHTSGSYPSNADRRLVRVFQRARKGGLVLAQSRSARHLLRFIHIHCPSGPLVCSNRAMLLSLTDPMCLTGKM